MVNEYEEGSKNRHDSKSDIAEYCADAINNGLICRYLAYRNETIDKTNEIRAKLHGRNVQSSSYTGASYVINWHIQTAPQ